MSSPEIPEWLKTLPRAPVYRPTETEFADPIAFISRIEREAAAFGICKVIPPLPKPSKKFVLANLNRSLSNSPDHVPLPNPGDSDAVFTTRHQELGTVRVRTPVHKRVWQSGESYTLEQFEAKSKAFAKNHLAGFKEVTPMLVETLFWKAAAEKPIYIEYANDVPGSGFGVPEEPFRWFYSRRRKRKRAFGCPSIQETKLPRRVDWNLDSESRRESMGSAGWKLSNSPWNLQVIARSPGSITRFMPDEVPGVTSPMVYIGMLFSWFAWHVEDHELHSMNFLHVGAPKTWYAVPGDHAATLEEIIRVQGYGGSVDPLASLAMLGEKTTLLSPEILVASGVPCCRLVQNPGEFVVTFPRAYHIGFSHGFNCGEAANFATSQWLKFAKDAAVRRAAMDYLPMLSHQQLLYMLAISFISRIPRELLPGGRTSRLRDRNKEEREFMVKKAFLHDMMNENQLLCSLLDEKSIPNVVLWEPDLLAVPCTGPHPYSFPLPLEAHERRDNCGTEMTPYKQKCNSSADSKMDDFCIENVLEGTVQLTCTKPRSISVSIDIDACSVECDSPRVEKIDCIDADEDDLPFGLSIDSGSLACVACGILGYPFMAILQPSEKALKELSPVNREEADERIKMSQCSSQAQCLPSTMKKFHSESLNTMKESSLSMTEAADLVTCQANKITLDQTESLTTSSVNSLRIDSCEGYGGKISLVEDQVGQLCYQNDNNDHLSTKDSIPDYSNGQNICNRVEEVGGKNDVSIRDLSAMKTCIEPDRLPCTEVENCHGEVTEWSTSNEFVRPRIFCLQHALEVEKLLQCKGGAHVLVICHSDYLRIKALAISIAEEIGGQFDCKDIPLENASPSDLHLLNTSIDDEEHEEDGRDWTSSLGLNLKYCVKLRKQSSANQEQLALSLQGIPFDHSPVSVVSNLKWLCRKPRTPYKVLGISQSRFRTYSKMVDTETRKTNINHLKVQTCEKVQSAISSSFCGSPRDGLPIQLDCQSINQFDRDDQTGTCGLECFHCETFNDSDLLTVPISIAECSQIHQGCWLRQGINTSHEVINSLTSQDSPPRASRGNESVKESSEIRSGTDILRVPVPLDCKSHQSCYNVPILACLDIHEKITDGSCFNRKSNVANNTESQEDIMRLEDESSLVQQKVDTLNGPNFEAEIPDLDSGHANSLLVENLLLVPVSPSDVSDVLPEVLANEEPLTHDIAGAPSTSRMQFSHAGTLFTTHACSEVSFAKVHAPCSGSALAEIQPSIVSEIDNSILVNNSAMEQERHIENTMLLNSEASHSYKAEMRGVDSSVETIESIPMSARTLVTQEDAARVGSVCGDNDSCTSDIRRRSIGNSARIDIIHYVRRKKKGKHEVDEETDNSFGCNDFIRSPCEGLRPRTEQRLSLKNDAPTLVKQVSVQGIKKSDTSVVRKGKSNLKESLKCDLEGCSMSFQSRGELSIHKRNRCTIEGCGKRFSSHRSTVRHYCTHTDERPLKCPWKGCNMSFKWAWARTEHIRVHTGERPYKCKVAGCGQTFRYVSDFSRHRRKTGHYVNSSAT